MNELTFALFDRLSTAKDPDEEDKGMLLSWLAAVLRIPWLDETEQENAAAMLDFLDGLSGVEDFAPLIRAVRTRLRFVRDPVWQMELPENYRACVNGEELDADGLRRRGVPYVDFRISKPIRNSQEFCKTRRLYADGRVEFLAEYQVFDAPPVGERHVFSTYGEKAVNR